MTQSNDTNTVSNASNLANVQVGGHGNRQTAGDIHQGSSEDLKSLVEALVAAVSDLKAKGEVDPDDTNDASDLASSIQQEASQKSPDTSKIKRLVIKLKAIGEKVGPPAVAVITAATAIIGVL